MDMPSLIDRIYEVGFDKDLGNALGGAVALVFRVEKVALIAVEDGKYVDLFGNGDAIANLNLELSAPVANEMLVRLWWRVGSINRWIAGAVDRQIEAKLGLKVPPHRAHDDLQDEICGLLPHLARALRLRQRLQRATRDARLATLRAKRCRAARWWLMPI